MSGNLPSGVTDADIDRAAPDYYDEARQMKIAETVMEHDRNMLRELARSDEFYAAEPSHAPAMALLSLMCVARDLAKCELTDFDRRIIKDAIRDLTEIINR